MSAAFPFRLEPRPAPPAWMHIGVPALAILLTVGLGFVVFGVSGKPPLQAMWSYFVEPLSSVNGWSELLLKASPLCLIGLGLSVAYRANVWNIGAEGQMLVGGICAAGVALFAGPGLGGWSLFLMALAGMAGGMAWAAVPAVLRTRFNTNEILTSLMLTYVAGQLVVYLVGGPWRDPLGMNFPVSAPFGDESLLPRLATDWRWDWLAGTRLHAFVFVSACAVPLVWLFVSCSFEAWRMRVGGLAPLAARHAGFSQRRAVWMALLVSGGLAGLAGMGELAGLAGQLSATWHPGYGFTAIIVAFVGRQHPVGVVLASLLMALLYLGGESVQSTMQLPQALSGVFQGVLLFCLLGCELPLRYRLRRRSSAARSFLPQVAGA
jgi:general nucleoside transport system permease protein